MRVAWRQADTPLPAAAVAASGPLAARLAAKSSTRGDLHLTRFAEWIVVEGEDLPWVDGVTYLGVLPGTSDVLVPVHRVPALHAELVRRAARAVLADEGTDRVCLVPHGERVVLLPLGPSP
jgi:hypothetical protein